MPRFTLIFASVRVYMYVCIVLEAVSVTWCRTIPNNSSIGTHIYTCTYINHFVCTYVEYAYVHKYVLIYCVWVVSYPAASPVQPLQWRTRASGNQTSVWGEVECEGGILLVDDKSIRIPFCPRFLRKVTTTSTTVQLYQIAVSKYAFYRRVHFQEFFRDFSCCKNQEIRFASLTGDERA
jgi:hypothetical protein